VFPTIIKVVKLTIGKRRGGSIIKRSTKFIPVDLDLSGNPEFAFNTPTDFRIRTTIHTLPLRVVYPAVLHTAYKLSKRREPQLAALNLLVGIASCSIEGGHFTPEYRILTHENDAIAFKLVGGRGNKPFWKATVGFPGTCYSNLRDSLESHLRLNAILSSEGQ
jgi:hypothetical protein